LSALSYLEDLSSAEETVLLFREKSMGLERDIFVEMAVFMWKFGRGGSGCSTPVACGLCGGLSEGGEKPLVLIGEKARG